jgi:hypothetical protein
MVEKVIVIDTETIAGTYGLLSVGAVVLALDGQNVLKLDRYFGFSVEYNYGCYFPHQVAYAKRNRVRRKPQLEIEAELSDLARRYDVNTAFAYNAKLDKEVSRVHFPSLDFTWLDLMMSARKVLASDEHYPAYKQLHPHIELTRKGILKRGYSVECVGRYLGRPHETHVSIEDAELETEIATRLGLFEHAVEC